MITDDTCNKALEALFEITSRSIEHDAEVSDHGTLAKVFKLTKKPLCALAILNHTTASRNDASGIAGIFQIALIRYNQLIGLLCSPLKLNENELLYNLCAMIAQELITQDGIFSHSFKAEYLSNFYPVSALLAEKISAKNKALKQQLKSDIDALEELYYGTSPINRDNIAIATRSLKTILLQTAIFQKHTSEYLIYSILGRIFQNLPDVVFTEIQTQLEEAKSATPLFEMQTLFSNLHLENTEMEEKTEHNTF